MRRWTFPFVVVGMNSMVMYLFAALAAGWVRQALYLTVGRSVFDSSYGPIFESLIVLAIGWLICFTLYRRRIFVRI
jgi:predicted acyltransferase